MKAVHLFLSLMILVFLLPGALADTVGQESGNVEILFFYNQHCTECLKTITYLENFSETHPEVRIEFFDVFNNPENQQMFEALNERYGAPFSPVPAVFVSDRQIIGYERITNELEDAVKEAGLPHTITPMVTLTPAETGSVTGERSTLTVPMIVTAALIDGINPCAFAVLIFLLLSLLSMESKRRVLLVGSAYIGAVFVFYFLSGLGLFTLVQVSGVSRWFSIIAACLALAAGVLTLRDAFSKTAGPLMAIPISTKGILDRYLKKSTIPAAIILGVLVGMFELPCTGGIYLAILSMLSGSMTLAAGIPLLLLYNLIFVLPLVVILGIVYFGVAPERIESWRLEKKRVIRVLMGLLMIGLGAFLLIHAL